MRTSADIYTDFSHLAELRRQSRQDDIALEEAAKQFEAMFLQMVLKQMRQASPGDPIFDSDRSRFYQEMHDKQLALHLSEGGSVGIADMIVRQLGGRIGTQERSHSLDDYRATPVAATFAMENPDAEAGKALPPSRAKRADEGFGRPYSPVNRTDTAPSQAAPEEFATLRYTRSGQPEKFESPQQFIQSLLPLAGKAAAKIGVDPKMLVAQAALETGWGKKIIQHPDGSSSHNLFNIKAGRNWKGDRVQVSTLEHIDGVAVRQRAQFRAYNDYRQSFDDYVDLLHKPRYAQALRNAKDPEKYIEALQHSGYATDPNYAQKILAIYRRQTLAAF